MRWPIWAMFIVPTEEYTKPNASKKIMDEAMDTIT